jgi:hypothetical protein
MDLGPLKGMKIVAEVLLVAVVLASLCLGFGVGRVAH